VAEDIEVVDAVIAEAEEVEDAIVLADIDLTEDSEQVEDFTEIEDFITGFPTGTSI